MASEDKTREFEALKRQAEENTRKKIILEEKYNAATERMKAVVAEIRAAGYDPKTLDAVLADLEQQLDKAFAEYKASVMEQTKAISAIESSL